MAAANTCCSLGNSLMVAGAPEYLTLSRVDYMGLRYFVTVHLLFTNVVTSSTYFGI